MNASPLVSIIINNYNYARFLADAIDSALAQAYAPVELIVVDDGSTDHSRQVIQSYGNRLAAIYQENGGQASAINTGFVHSHGEIVIFLDADDILMPGIAGSVVDAFESNREVVKVQYRMEVIDAQGHRTGIFKPATHLPLLNGDLCRQVLNFPDDIPWLPTSGNAFTACVLKKIFPIPEKDYPILADFYLSHLTPLFGPIITLPEVGAFYRVHGTNAHELSTEMVNLDHIRNTLLYWDKTHAKIREYAQKLGLNSKLGKDQISSVSYVAHRLISLRLDPGNHPYPQDTVLSLLKQGIRVSLHRFDVSLWRRYIFILWFLAMAVAPEPFTSWLAERFLFPHKRGKALSLYHLLQRKGSLGFKRRV